MSSEYNSDYMARRAKLASKFGAASPGTLKEAASPSLNSERNRPSDSIRVRSSSASYTNRVYSSERIRSGSIASSATSKMGTSSGYGSDGSSSTSGRSYSRNSAYDAVHRNTRFATRDSSAHKIEQLPNERIEAQEEQKPGISERIAAYIRTTYAVPKAVIVCLVLVLALSLCIPLIGSHNKSVAQNELNGINQQIKDADHEIAELNEAYLCSIDSNEACAAASEAGMKRNAQCIPIHP